MSLLVKDTLYSVSKDLKVAGKLAISPSHIDWEPQDATQCQPLSIAVNSVPDSLQRAKGKPLLRIPLRTGALVFEFETEVDRDQAVDVLTPLLKEAQRKGKGAAAGPSAAGAVQPAAVASGPQAALKQQLLKEDRDLQQLYQQLVVRGVLSEEEFWRGRQSLLKQRMLAGAAQKQRKGFDNAMISELADGGGNKVTFKLTPEVMQQIFGERPHIRRAFAALVPQSVSEKQFWERFFKYEVARKMRSTNAGDEPEDPYKDFLDQERDSREARSRLGSVDPTVNLAADNFDRPLDSSAAATAQEGMRARQSAHVIHDINQHAAVVMQGLPQAGEQDADGRLRRSREAATSGGSALQLEDLQGPAATGFSRLRIQDPKRFYESMGGAAEEAQEPPMENGRTDESMAGAGDALAAVEQLCRTGLGSPAVDPGASQRALLELCQGFHDRGNPLAALQAGLGGGGMQQQQQQQLLPQLQGVLRETVLTGNELLRHFWGAFPLSSAAREARALRLKRALAEQFDRTTAMQEAAAGAERVRITQLLKPLRAALDAALSKHDREVELRSAGQ